MSDDQVQCLKDLLKAKEEQIDAQRKEIDSQEKQIKLLQDQLFNHERMDGHELVHKKRKLNTITISDTSCGNSTNESNSNSIVVSPSIINALKYNAKKQNDSILFTKKDYMGWISKRLESLLDKIKLLINKSSKTKIKITISRFASGQEPSELHVHPLYTVYILKVLIEATFGIIPYNQRWFLVHQDADNKKVFYSEEISPYDSDYIGDIEEFTDGARFNIIDSSSCCEIPEFSDFPSIVDPNYWISRKELSFNSYFEFKRLKPNDTVTFKVAFSGREHEFKFHRLDTIYSVKLLVLEKFKIGNPIEVVFKFNDEDLAPESYTIAGLQLELEGEVVEVFPRPVRGPQFL